jgi:hypothetical protein
VRQTRQLIDRAMALNDLAVNGWLDPDAATTYEMPPQSAHDRLRRLIDAAEPDIGTANARLLRWHLSVSR